MTTTLGHFEPGIYHEADEVFIAPETDPELARLNARLGDVIDAKIMEAIEAGAGVTHITFAKEKTTDDDNDDATDDGHESAVLAVALYPEAEAHARPLKVIHDTTHVSIERRIEMPAAAGQYVHHIAEGGLFSYADRNGSGKKRAENLDGPNRINNPSYAEMMIGKIERHRPLSPKEAKLWSREVERKNRESREGR